MDEKHRDSSSTEKAQATDAKVAPRRIVLTGFMGSGKSTCGKLLAKRIEWRFVDVDLLIEAEAGMKIAEIFAQIGEARFREMEAEAIRRLLDEQELVIALGGGAIESEEVRRGLKEAETLLVHLEVSLEKAKARCRGSESTRPVLADEENLKARYKRRVPLYREARINLNVDTLTPQEVIEEILGSTEF